VNFLRKEEKNNFSEPDHSNAVIYNCPGLFRKRIGFDSAVDYVNCLGSANQALENLIFPNDGLESMEGPLRVGRMFDD